MMEGMEQVHICSVRFQCRWLLFKNKRAYEIRFFGLAKNKATKKLIHSTWVVE